VNSRITDDFVQLFGRLPNKVQRLARKNYRLWRRNSAHPSLRFKLVHQNEPLYSVRVGSGYRAVG
jgi:hypothetical protein